MDASIYVESIGWRVIVRESYYRFSYNQNLVIWDSFSILLRISIVNIIITITDIVVIIDVGVAVVVTNIIVIN